MENFDRALELQAISLNSAGSAMQQFNIYQEGTAAKMSELTNQFQIFASTLIDSDLVKLFIDLGTSILKLASSDMAQLVIQASLLTGVFKLGSIAIASYKGSLLQTAIGVIALDVAEKGLIATTQSLWTAMIASPLAPWIALGAAIFAIVAIVDNVTKAYERQVEKVKQLQSEYNNLQSNVTSIEQEIESVSEKLDILNSKGLQITDDEETEKKKLENINEQLLLQLEIQKELSKIAGERAEQAAVELLEKRVASYGAEGQRGLLEDVTISERIQRNIEYYNALQKQIEDLTKTQAKLAESGETNSDQFKINSQDIDWMTERYKELKEQILIDNQFLLEQKENLIGTTEAGNNWASAIDIVSEAVRQFLGVSDKANEDIEKLTEKFQQLTKEELETLTPQQVIIALDADFEFVGDSLENLQKQINEVIDEQIVVQKTKELEAAYVGLTNKISILSKAMQEQSDLGYVTSQTYKEIMENAGLTKEEIAELEKLFKLQNGELQTSKENMTNYMNSLVETATTSAILNNATKDQINNFKSLYNSAYDVQDAISDMASNMDKVESVFKDFNDTGKLTAKNILDLVDAGYSSIIMFDEEGNAIGLNSDAFIDLTNAMINAKIAKLEIEKADIKKSLEEERQKVEELAIAYSYMANNAAAAAAIQSALAKAQSEIISGEEIEQAITTQIASYQALFNKTSEIPLAKSKERTKKEQDLWKEAFEEELKDLEYSLNKREISEEEYLNRLRDLNEKYFSDKEKYLEDYRKYELEVLDGLAKIEETRLKNLLEFAKLSGDYSGQLKIFEQMQEDIHQLAEKYRELGYKETDIEIQELQKKWLDYAINASDILKTISENRIKNLENELYALELANEKTVDYFKFTGTFEFDLGTYSEQISKIQEINKEYEKLIETIKSKPEQIFTQEDIDSLNNYQKNIDDNNKKITSLIKEEYNLQIQALKDYISERNYHNDWGADNEIATLQRALAYNEEYYSKLEGFEDERLAKREEILHAIDQAEQALVSRAIELMKEQIDLYKEQREEVKERYELEIEKIDEIIKKLKDRYEIERDKIDDQIKAVNDRIKAEDKAIKAQEAADKEAERIAKWAEEDLKHQEDQQKRLLEIEKLRIELANTAREKNIRQLQELGDGKFEYVYVADEDKIADTQQKILDKEQEFKDAEVKFAEKRAKELLEVEKQKNQALLELQREQELETLNFQKETLKNQYETELKSLESQKEYLKIQFDTDQTSFNKRIKELEKFIKDEEKKISNHQNQQISDLQTLQSTLIFLDISGYEQRLTNLGRFVEEWNEIIARMRNSFMGYSSGDLPQLAVGGKIKETGAAILHPEERVLTAPVTAVFDRFTDSLQQNGVIDKLVNLLENSNPVASNIKPNLNTSDFSGLNQTKNSSQSMRIDNLNITLPEVKEGNDFINYITNNLPLLAIQH